MSIKSTPFQCIIFKSQEFKYHCIVKMILSQGVHSIVKNTGGGAGSIVWGLGVWLGKDILLFFKNIDLDNS